MGHSKLDRMNFKTKLDGALSPKVKFSVNFNPSYSRSEAPAVNFTDYYRFYSGLPVRPYCCYGCLCKTESAMGQLCNRATGARRDISAISFTRAICPMVLIITAAPMPVLPMEK